MTESASDRAVVLLSGGLDSATTLAIARAEGLRCYALSFDYGQRHRCELDAAARIAEAIGVVAHQWVRLDLRAFGGSALTDAIDVPKDRDESEMAETIPTTYVPARNTIFLSYALAYAEVVGARHLFIGVNAVDYSGYPDCRPEYIRAFQQLADLATRAGVEGRGVDLHTPLIDLPKTEIIQRGLDLGVDYAMTHSCYDPDGAGRPCGRCDACRLRINAFDALGMADPAMMTTSRRQ